MPKIKFAALLTIYFLMTLAFFGMVTSEVLAYTPEATGFLTLEIMLLPYFKVLVTLVSAVLVLGTAVSCFMHYDKFCRILRTSSKLSSKVS